MTTDTPKTLEDVPGLNLRIIAAASMHLGLRERWYPASKVRGVRMGGDCK